MARGLKLCWLAIAALVAVPASVRAQVTFTDATAEAGVYYDHVTQPETVPCTSMAGGCERQVLNAGATVGDYNDDGCQDLFVTRFDATDLLFENQCDGTFLEVGGLVGLSADVQSNGALFVDVDSDGDLDLYLANHHGTPVLYRNDGGNDGDWLRVRVKGVASLRHGRGAKVTVTSGNGSVDVCDIVGDPGLDLNGDGIIDTCPPQGDPPNCIRRIVASPNKDCSVNRADPSGASAESHPYCCSPASSLCAGGLVGSGAAELSPCVSARSASRVRAGRSRCAGRRATSSRASGEPG